MPLLFDMPREELEGYQGTNPKPDDFDTYWDAALAEMKALDPQVELEPADFQSAIADCFRPLVHRRGRRTRACQAAAPQADR